MSRIVRTTAVLNGAYGANAWVETPVGGRSDWTNEVNATGRANGGFATLTGDALAARGGRLDLDYANFVGKSQFTIISVLLRFYAKMTGAPALGLTTPISFQWSKSATINTVATRNVNFDSVATPIEVDITASITGWADLDAIKTYVSASTALAETPVISLDAVHLVVNAESVVTL